MPAQYKTTWFFEGLQQNYNTTASSIVAWTETWYQTADSVDAALVRARLTTPNSWLGKRRGFMHAAYQVKWVRCTNDSNPRDTKLAHIDAGFAGVIGYSPGTLGKPEINYSTCAQVNCAVLVDFVAIPAGAGERTRHRRVLLRGLPRSIMDGNTLVEHGQAWTGLLAFCDFVGRGRSPNSPLAGTVSDWMIRYQAATAQYVPITNLVVDVDNPRKVAVTVALPDAARGSRMIVKQVTQPRGMNRTWTLLADRVNPAAYQLGKSRFDLAGAWSHDGQAALVTPAYSAARQYIIIGLRDRQTGAGVFGRTRGRRRAK